MTWIDHGCSAAVGLGLVGPEAGVAVGRHRDEPGALAPDAVAEEPLAHLVRAPQPEVVGRHRHDGVVVQERDQGGDVVALEGVDVAGQQLLLLGARPPAARGRRRRRGSARVARARWRALLTDATRGVEQLGHLGGLPAQHLAEDEHRPLAGGQVLEGGDEGQPDRLPGLGHLGRVAVGGRSPGRRGSADPGVLGPGGAGEARRPAPAGPRSMARARRWRPRSMSRQTLVAIRYSHERSAERPSKLSIALPGPHHRLLDGVLGLEGRAEHPVAVAGELPAVLLQVVFQPDLAPNGHGPRFYGGVAAVWGTCSSDDRARRNSSVVGRPERRRVRCRAWP